MIGTLNPSDLRRTQPYEYDLRFLFGGLITVAAGAIAHRFGPAVGGLFLAFSAIFPSSATLIERHESIKKQKARLNGKRRAAQAAAIDAIRPP
jgi:hypothetical protein